MKLAPNAAFFANPLEAAAPAAGLGITILSLSDIRPQRHAGTKKGTNMRRLAAIAILTAISFTAIGDERPDKKLAMEYLQVSHTKETIDATLATYRQQMGSQLPLEMRAKLDGLMQATMGWDAVKDDLANRVTSTYTAGELQAAIAFMRTPLGASFTSKNEEFSAQFAEIISRRMREFLQQALPEPAAQPSSRSGTPRSNG